MYKTVATAPYLAALLATNSVGLELVSGSENKSVATTLNADGLDLPSGAKTPQETRFSRLRKMSDSPPIPCVSRRASKPIETQTSLADKHHTHNESADPDWRPIFHWTDRKTNIRRLYPSKINGRVHLAQVSPGRTNASYKHSRHSSGSSAASAKGTPSPVATKSAYFDDLDVRESGDPRSDLVEHFSRTLTSNVSEDTTYGTMKQEDGAKFRDSAAANGFVGHKGEPGEASFTDPISTIDDTSFIQTPAERLKSANVPPQLPSAFRKGHGRNESIASVWTVDSSSSEDESTPINKRKPLQLHTRPPLPWMKRESAVPLSNVDANEAAAQMAVPIRSTSDHSERPPIPPRTSSRKSSYRRQSLPTDPDLRSATGAFESWDEEFGGTTLQVPESIRESQATLRNHLWQLRHFSNLISELKSMRARHAQDSQDSQVWQETEAMIMIASYGDDDEADTSVEYNHAQDVIVSRILGRPMGAHKKVKLDGCILASLIDKAENLLAQLTTTTTLLPQS